MSMDSFFKKHKSLPFIVTGVLSSVISVFLVSVLMEAPLNGVPADQSRIRRTSGFLPFLQENKEEQVVQTQTVPEPRTLSVSDVVENVNDSVVAIEVYREVPLFVNEQVQGGDPFFGFFMPFVQRRQVGTELRKVGGGSGFFVSSDGLLVTNRHVVDGQGASFKVVLTSGRSVDATLVASDSVLDVALLRAQGNGYTPLTFGDSSTLRLGQGVVAIGFALAEFTNSVSSGVISGLSRSITAGDSMGRAEVLDQLIQTDAAINPGNSGGPLLNLQGQVIGVNVAVAQGSQNIGFALPSNVVKQIVDSVRSSGTIVRPYLGIRYTQITPALKNQQNLAYDYGIIVRRGQGGGEPGVQPGSPAEKAGILEEDIILSMDGVNLTSQNNFASLLRQKRIGERVTLRISRGGVERTTSVVLERNPQ